MRAAGYVRVSTQEQVKNGWNLDEDRDLIRELCESKGWELVEVFDDGGLRGDDPNRPGLLRMLASLDRFDVLIVRDLDRLARDAELGSRVIKVIGAAGVKLETFQGPVDIETSSGQALAEMRFVFGKEWAA
jgi:site-specific DNA recombinase